MPRRLAPAGAPIKLADLAQWASVSVSTTDVGDALRQEIADRFQVRHSVLVSTGRAGMTLLLRAMRRCAPADRDEVVLPSYTCYSVAASVVKAGLRPRLVDIVPETLDLSAHELGRTDFSRVLAVVTTSLYGLPGDLPSISRLARERGVFLIDDAAQAMGAQVQGRWSGTWGDAGLFSFDKGKNVAAVDGGVILTGSDELARALRQEMAGLSAPGVAASALHIVKALAYSVLLRPWLYGFATRLPGLGLGKTVFSTDFPLEVSDRALVALGLTMIRRLDEFTRARVANATALIEGLAGLAGIRVIQPLAGSLPVYLRLPVLFDSAGARDAAVEALNAVGIGSTRSYPASLADVPELQHLIVGDRLAAGGRRVASTIATLPTHPFVSTADRQLTLVTLGAR